MEKTKVKLIGKTAPLIDGITNTEEYIAYVARVSNPGNQMNNETAPRLLKYLIKNHHWSPFEMAHFVIEVRTTRDIGRQILRHRSFSFQEFSGRYAMYDMDDLELREARLQDNKNRQNSLQTDDNDLKFWFDETQLKIAENAAAAYYEALERGIAKEQARALLPEGLVPTTIFMSGTVRSWIHYIMERNRPGVVQAEHVEIAKQCLEIIRQEIPSVAELVLNH